MKFLIDNMLSPELAQTLQDDYPGTGHVQEELYPKAKDTRIWQHAVENGFTILSKDGEFVKLLADRGHPPKVVRLRIGNCTTLDISETNRVPLPAHQKGAGPATASHRRAVHRHPPGPG